MTEVSNDERDSEVDRRTGSWKLEFIETLNADPMVKTTMLKVMLAYLSFAGAKRQAYVSNSVLKAKTNAGRSAVIEARKALEKLGYLSPLYPVGEGSMLYRVENVRQQMIADHVNIALETIREEGNRRKTWQRNRKAALGPEFGPPDMARGSRIWTPTSPEFGPNTLEEYPVVGFSEKRETQKERIEGNAYAMAKDGDDLSPIPIPQTEDEAVDMVMDMLHGAKPPVVLQLFDVLRTRLMAGDLSPAEVRDLLEDAA